MKAQLVKYLSALSHEPSGRDEFNNWLQADDALTFLKSDSESASIVLYATLPNVFINSVVIPDKALKSASDSQLLRWNFNAYSGWGVTVWFSPKKTEVTPPLDGEGKLYSLGEQLVFARSFSGRTGEKHYHEILQKFIQIADIHYVKVRKAYCRIDQNGDLEDVLSFIEIEPSDETTGGTVITCNRQILDQYLALVRSSLVRMFDFTRLRTGQFGGWGNMAPVQEKKEGLIYMQALTPGYASYTRGVEIVRAKGRRSRAVGSFDPGRPKDRRFAKFIALDWRHDRKVEISCAPGSTANYFNGSQFPDLAFELSPAFFRPEVLAKYKADSGKYRLDDRTISCRDTWHLQNYDINEAGQVHTYLVYLRNLPYEEQQYWRAFNEPPKGTISHRSYLSDFEGSWEHPYDPLASLKEWARSTNKKARSWWKIRNENLLDQTRYPVTPSFDEWASEILHLDQLLVEGLNSDWLRKKAIELSRTPDKLLGSVKLLKECLIALSWSEAEITNAISPLETLHYLRTKVKGHAVSPNTLSEITQKVLSEHVTFQRHFRDLCKRCDHSLRLIAASLDR